MNIYTRTGDSGETSLFGGARVAKSHERIDACGEVDELNAWLGLVCSSLRARAEAARHADVIDALERIQRDLFALGAQIADPAERIAERVAKTVLGDADAARLEGIIDRLESELAPLQRFILPGGIDSGAFLHVARTVCRRAERRMVALTPPIDRGLIVYINRLSDLLFVMARAINHRAGQPETEW